MADINATILQGKIAAPVEIRTFDSGESTMRLLLTVRSTSPKRRVDVVPVIVWQSESPDIDFEYIAKMPVGTLVHIYAAIQRRFWSDERGRSSRLEVVARDITVLFDAGCVRCGETDLPLTGHAEECKGRPVNA